MKQILPALVMATFLSGAAVPFANAQNAPGTANPGRRTFIDSEITIGVAFPPIETKAFVSTPVLPLKKGTVLPARGVIASRGMDQMWSLTQHDFAIGSQTLKYSVTGLVRCSNFSDTGSFARVIASTTVIKVDLKPGGALHSGPYRIEAKHRIKAGENIPSLRVVTGGKSYIFSIEEASPPPSQVNAPGPQPRLTIVDDPVTSAERDIAMEAWRTATQRAKEGIVTAPR
jgi:hypothetical protein